MVDLKGCQTRILALLTIYKKMRLELMTSMIKSHKTKDMESVVLSNKNLIFQISKKLSKTRLSMILVTNYHLTKGKARCLRLAILDLAQRNNLILSHK